MIMRKKWTSKDFKFNIGDKVKGVEIVGYTYTKFNDEKHNKAFWVRNIEENIIFKIEQSGLTRSKSTNILPRGKQARLFNTVAKKRPDLVPFIVDTEDLQLQPASNKKVRVQCPICKKVNEKTMTVNDLARSGFNCKDCTLHKSFPQQVLEAYLTLNNINYVTEYHIRCNNKNRYIDIMIPSKSIAIEIHGFQHYNDVIYWRDTLSHHEISTEDKKKYCKDNNIKLIEIDARESKLTYIKKSIKNSDLSYLVNVPDMEVMKYVQQNNYTLKKMTDMYNKGYTLEEIGQEFNMSPSAIGIRISQLGLKSRYKKKVRCINTGDMFESVTGASKWAGIKSVGSVCNALKGRTKYSGTLNGERLYWEYVE